MPTRSVRTSSTVVAASTTSADADRLGDDLELGDGARRGRPSPAVAAKLAGIIRSARSGPRFSIERWMLRWTIGYADAPYPLPAHADRRSPPQDVAQILLTTEGVCRSRRRPQAQSARLRHESPLALTLRRPAIDPQAERAARSGCSGCGWRSPTSPTFGRPARVSEPRGHDAERTTPTAGCISREHLRPIHQPGDAEGSAPPSFRAPRSRRLRPSPGR
jgi:hypothetical protein